MYNFKQSVPLYEALQALVMRDTVRFHMPGHKGKPVFEPFRDIYPIDFTETYGTGNLYDGKGPIRTAETYAARYYGAPSCHFLTGGSTQGIFSMLYAACTPGDTVIFDRASHKSAVAACALYDINPIFVYPQTTSPYGFSGLLSLDETESVLKAHPEATALHVVSPNYYGIMQDIPALANLCHKYKKLLLVDAAHGAHLPALGYPSSVAQGADAAVVSAHKTLPCLGQGSFLLFSQAMNPTRLREGAALVGTSSPSYPIMASLDLSRAWLEGAGHAAYQAAQQHVDRLRTAINRHTPFTAISQQDFPLLDPCRLTIYCAGHDAHAIASALYENHDVACEMADNRNLVFISTGADTAIDFMRLKRALMEQARQYSSVPSTVLPMVPPHAERVCSVRNAWFSPSQTVPLLSAENHICARAVTPYPPGIPLLWPGEKITTPHIEFLTQKCYTKHTEIEVISENGQ